MKTLFALLILPILGFIRTLQLQRSPLQKEFLKGKIPKTSPNGFYKGTAYGLRRTAWQGKKFDAKTNTGINIMKKGEGTEEQFAFISSVGPGLRDTSIQVLKIDYSQTKKPFWVRIILDEVVETAPGTLLGKVHVRLIPGFPFTVGFFKLEKEN